MSGPAHNPIAGRLRLIGAILLLAVGFSSHLTGLPYPVFHLTVEIRHIGGPLVPPAPPAPPAPLVPPCPIADAKGPMVLIVENSRARDTLSKGQQDLLFSRSPGSFGDIALKNVAKDASGSPEFLRLDIKDDVGKLPPLWQEIWARPARATSQLPYLAIYVPGGGFFEGPLPADEQAGKDIELGLGFKP